MKYLQILNEKFQNPILLFYQNNAKRYQTEELKVLVEKLEEAEETLRKAFTPFLKRLFRRFQKGKWSAYLSAIAEIDCLVSLAVTSYSEPNMVRPKILNSDTPHIEISKLRHPWVEKLVKRFIPNDVKIGGDEPLVHLITGPNMGGKSTILRQIWIAVILCQIGCFIPAESAKMTLIDRIFTRIGSSDNLIKSTFYIEMEETKTIVENSTARSLVIMDELGRGTSTFDGYSIAHAVLSYHVKHNPCLTLFTTHNHMLVDAFCKNPQIQAMKMSWYIDMENDEVKFLFKFEKGSSKNSEGILIAKMTQVPDQVCKRAQILSDLFKQKLNLLEKKFVKEYEHES